MKFLPLILIRFYQRYLSFDTGLFRIFFPSVGTCRFSPRCSEYFYQAVAKYGILHGSLLGFKRLLRCHPGSPGGSDPVV